MITFLTWLFTALLVLDCVVLILLILLQLPKKEAGVGTAFGGAATDALFGAGSGNVLTRITKYAATGFFALALCLAVMGKFNKGTGGSLQEELMKKGSTPPAAAPSSAPQTGNLLQTPAPATPAPATPAPATPAPTAPQPNK